MQKGRGVTFDIIKMEEASTHYQDDALIFCSHFGVLGVPMMPFFLVPLWKMWRAPLAETIQQRKTAIFNLFTPVCNDSVTQLLPCQDLCDPQWIKHSLWCTIFQNPLTVLFPAIEEAGGKLFIENGGRRRIGHPRSVKDTTFGRSKSFTFIALSLGPFGTRRWNWGANVSRCFHLALSSTPKFPGQR